MQASTILPSGKRLVGTEIRSLRSKQKYFFLLPAIEPRFLGGPAHRLLSITGKFQLQTWEIKYFKF